MKEEEEAYNHYLMSHLLDSYTDQLRFIECDEAWEQIKYHMKKFKESKYYVIDQSMYESIEAYVKTL
jgi:hypothetical protein